MASREALRLAHERAALMPDCLVEARRVANSVISGWHGRRKRGIGENFWQFRPYAEGESLSRIDWRRSARDDHTYVRDREWEAAHTILLHADLTPSMRYRSRMSNTSKEARALVLMLALAETLSRSGERIGVPGLLEPQASRQAAERIAAALSHAGALPALPQVAGVRSTADLILLGDFLDNPADTVARLKPLAHRGVRGHLVEIADPAEESFPYTGRTEFVDPETGKSLTAGRADSIAEDYRRAYEARRETLGTEMRRLGWNFITHRTDRPASEPLTQLHLLLSGGGLATHEVRS
nr:DUF58 domain-containing protein [Gellertiella hungarica]